MNRPYYIRLASASPAQPKEGLFGRFRDSRPSMQKTRSLGHDGARSHCFAMAPTNRTQHANSPNYRPTAIGLLLDSLWAGMIGSTMWDCRSRS